MVFDALWLFAKARKLFFKIKVSHFRPHSLLSTIKFNLLHTYMIMSLNKLDRSLLQKIYIGRVLLFASLWEAEGGPERTARPIFSNSYQTLSEQESLIKFLWNLYCNASARAKMGTYIDYICQAVEFLKLPAKWFTGPDGKKKNFLLTADCFSLV